MRLAQGLNPGGPNLYRRGYYRAGYPYGRLRSTTVRTTFRAATTTGDKVMA